MVGLKTSDVLRLPVHWDTVLATQPALRTDSVLTACKESKIGRLSIGYQQARSVKRLEKALDFERYHNVTSQAALTIIVNAILVAKKSGTLQQASWTLGLTSSQSSGTGSMLTGVDDQVVLDPKRTQCRWKGSTKSSLSLEWCCKWSRRVDHRHEYESRYS